VPTYRLTVAYDGTEFRGWALQPGVRTVSRDLAVALAVDPEALTVAGRTDAGVHAAANVASALHGYRGRQPPPAGRSPVRRAADTQPAPEPAYVTGPALSARPVPARFELHHRLALDEPASRRAAIVTGTTRVFTPTETRQVLQRTAPRPGGAPRRSSSTRPPTLSVACGAGDDARSTRPAESRLGRRADPPPAARPAAGSLLVAANERARPVLFTAADAGGVSLERRRGAR
jgi:hypothetical protein